MKTTDPLAGIMAFLAVADRASCTAAAEDLEMGRTAVDAQIRALEARLGVRLLHRSTRSVRLTEAGTVYREALADIQDRVRDAGRTATAFQTEAVGRLRISAPPDLGPDHVAPVVARFLAENPAVSIDLQLSTDAVDLIGDSFDLAIRGALAVEPTLVTRQIGASPLIACASPSYLDQRGVPAAPQELATHACLHFSELRWGRKWRFERDSQVADVPVLPRLECNNGPTLLAAAIAGAGIALEPAFVVGPAIRAGTLVPILTGWRLPVIPVHAAYPANRNIASKVRSFVTLLATAFAGHPDLGGTPG
ncbi:HTH-type transcriptional regulator PgrR [Methylobacterium mesophilicum]|uniref:LysR family transcriptional regulator n=1 Tax=Methylobacterium mesophilicum TaxID=39956 RepID=UPI001EE158A1|nr:LysR family transcriptional regulator [Methylobacterium mesophilicum]GJE21866.1 HTH-type transcriptional regulator PgrR [Methylobacterium mesophilicum]